MTQLVGRFERPLFRFLLQLTGDAHLAEDLFQETFLRLHRARGSYDPAQPLKPYLYRIALNTVHDARARAAARPATVSLDQLPSRARQQAADDAGPPLQERITAAAPDPGEDCQRAETRLQVRTALAALPDMEREVVVLRVFEGLTFPEIARVTDTPVATAKSRMLYALRRLRPVLEAYVSGGAASHTKDAVP